MASASVPVYLDYNATTPLDPRVCASMAELLALDNEKVLAPNKCWGNPSSGHIFGLKAKEKLVEARNSIAKLIGAHSDEIIFNSGGTESINHVIKGLAFAEKARSGRRNQIITSSIEHVAVTETIDYLVANHGFRKVVVPVDGCGRVNPKDVIAALNDFTLLITIMLANNEVGTIQPLKEICQLVKGHEFGEGVAIHTDASQAVGKIPVHVKHLGVDFLTIAGHKIYAPKGIGALYVSSNAPPIQKFMHGANHEQNRRAGTENVLLAIGLGTACKIAYTELEEEMPKLSRLRDMLYDKLYNFLESTTDLSVRWNGDRSNMLPNTLSIGAPTAPEIIKAASTSVACSAGAACHTHNDAGDSETRISHVLRAMKIPQEYAISTLRLSVGRFTTESDIKSAAEALLQALVKRKVSRFS